MGKYEDLKGLYEAFWNMIFPPYCSCIICKGKLSSNFYGICYYCLEEIHFIKKGRWLQASNLVEGYSCRVFSVVEYTGEIRRLIYRLKYNHETYLAREMGKMMADFIQREGLIADLILPVPLHKSKKKERGFNQADLLAKYICQNTGVPYSSKYLIRSKKTDAMHRLTRMQRRMNVMGAFGVVRGEEIMGQDVILIDDIFTTGATIEACISALKKVGVSSVNVITFARGKIENQMENDDWKSSDNGELYLYNGK